MHVIAQQLRVVVEHLLEVRNDPALVDAIAMEAAGELVIDAAARHLFERHGEGLTGVRIAAVDGELQQKIERGGMGKLGLRPEAAVARIELGKRGGGDLVDQGERQFAAAAGEALIVLDGGHDAGSRFESLVAAVAPHLRHGEQDAAETRSAVAIVAREVGSAEVGAAVGGEERCERPSALAADGRDRSLVARVDVGTLVAIDFYGDDSAR